VECPVGCDPRTAARTNLRTDYNIIRMAMIAGIDWEREETNWAFDARSGPPPRGLGSALRGYRESWSVRPVRSWRIITGIRAQNRPRNLAYVTLFWALIALTRQGTTFDQFDLSKILSFQRPGSEQKRGLEDRDGCGRRYIGPLAPVGSSTQSSAIHRCTSA